MPVELQVDVNATGNDQIDKIVSSLAALESHFIKVAPVLTDHEKHLKEMAAQAKETSERFKQFGESIRDHIETPVGSASLSLGKLAESFGPVGVAAAATVGVLVGLGTAAFESMHKLGALGTEINNVSIRTGLSTQEVSLFTFAAKAAGADIGSFEMGMRMLSRALADNSEEGKKAKTALSSVGISARDAYGDTKNTSEIFLQISEAMVKMTSTADRNAFAMAVLGRQGLELVPTLLHLKENMDLAQKAGILMFNPDQIKDMQKYHDEVLLIGDAWDHLANAAERAAAASGAYIVQGAKDVSNIISTSNGLFGSTYKVDTLNTDFGHLAPRVAPGMSPGEMRLAQFHATQGIASASLAGTTPEERLADAQSRLAEKTVALNKLHDTGKITTGAGTEKSATIEEARALAKSYKAVTDEVTKATAAIAAMKAHAAALKEADAVGVRASEAGLGPIEKLQAERNQKAKLLTGTAPNLLGFGGTGEKGKLYSSYDILIGAESSKLHDKWNKDNDEGEKRDREALDKETKEKNQHEAEDMDDAFAEIKRTNRDKNTVAQKGYDIDASTQREQVTRQASKAQRMAELSTPLGSGPQGQQQAINDAYQIRIGLAHQLSAIELDRASKQTDLVKRAEDIEKSKHDLIKEAQDAELDKEMKLLELAKQQKEEARSMSGSVFDAIVSKDPSKGMRDFFMGQAKDVGRSVFSNLTAPVFEGMQATTSQLKTIGSSAAAHTPEMIARKDDTEATKANTTATVALTDAFTFMSTGGSAGKLPASAGGGAGVTSGGPAALGASLSAIPGFQAINKIAGGNLSTGVSTATSIGSKIRQLLNIPGSGSDSGGGGGGGSYGDSASPLWDFSQDDAPFDLGGGGVTSGGGDMAALATQGSVQAAVQSNANAMAVKMNNVAAVLTKAGAAFGTGASSVASGTALFGSPQMNSINGTSALGGGVIGTDIAGGDYAGAIGAGTGLAAATYAGVKTAMHDFSKGGAYGVIGGIGSVAQTAANFDPEPISHAVLESVAVIAQLTTAIMGDPRQARQNQINKELTNDAYNSTGYIDQHGNFVPGAQAKAISYFGASNGQSFDTNFQGGIRGGSYASTTRNVYDPSSAANQIRNGSIAPPPGYSFDQATGWGDRSPGATGPLPSVSAQAPIQITVHAMDSKSFLDNAANISAALRKGIQMGHSVIGEIQQVARTA